jgi:hypothetical protein
LEGRREALCAVSLRVLTQLQDCTTRQLPLEVRRETRCAVSPEGLTLFSPQGSTVVQNGRTRGLSSGEEKRSTVCCLRWCSGERGGGCEWDQLEEWEIGTGWRFGQGTIEWLYCRARDSWVPHSLGFPWSPVSLTILSGIRAGTALGLRIYSMAYRTRFPLLGVKGGQMPCPLYRAQPSGWDAYPLLPHHPLTPPTPTLENHEWSGEVFP